MKRMIIVSNRLPFRIEKRGNQVELKESDGGLVAAIKSFIERNKEKDQYKIKWVGSASFKESEWVEYEQKFGNSEMELCPVFLKKKTEKAFYEGFSNSTIWPLFHYFPSFVEFNEKLYDSYRAVNRAFADAIAAIVEPGDILWIHDYHFMLLPGYIRERNVHVPIGFFCHIPFPSYELFRLLPENWREEILNNLLGADLIGFQTEDYVNHFLDSVTRIMGILPQDNMLRISNRLCACGDYPISVDFNRFDGAYDKPVIQKNREKLLRSCKPQKIIFSVDRLDYTKGVMNRLEAFEQLLEENTDYDGQIIFILNVIPSRAEIGKYKERKRMIEESIGRINGKYGYMGWQPILYQYRHLNFNQLMVFYTSCDIALVTPLRDGMNLVAKEFVASRKDEKGVLVLSDMAGAAKSLKSALHVTPTDTKKMKECILHALLMPEAEQKARMRSMRQEVKSNDVSAWAGRFLDDLNKVHVSDFDYEAKFMGRDAQSNIKHQFKKSKKRLLLFDYDGTLVRITHPPDRAKPGDRVRELLERLSADERNIVVLISGRDKDTIEKWFGCRKVLYVAEHGALFKLPESNKWLPISELNTSWKPEMKRILEKFTNLYEGSFVEEKEYSLVWHYRKTTFRNESKELAEMSRKLQALDSSSGFKVSHGKKILELVCMTVNKGVIASKFLNTYRPDFVLALGDDTTDEDMFWALEASEYYTIKVGVEETRAKYKILNAGLVLSFLELLAS